MNFHHHYSSLSEIIMWWFGAQETFIVIFNVENSYLIFSRKP